ncbi:peptidoglycan DD-metalloendopeptidase family protein [Pyruvatibacter mobilis]|uniref:M23 family metallopeptidase n=1 Tax=Pyruvatibacter mobilis TaxID=1712261 RepID=UPI003D0DE59C
MTRSGRRDSRVLQGGISLKTTFTHRFGGLAGHAASFAGDFAAAMRARLMQHAAMSALVGRSLPVTALALAGGLVFTLGVAAAVLPGAGDTAPRLAQSTGAPGASVMVAPATTTAALRSDEDAPAQAALLPVTATSDLDDIDADGEITTASVQASKESSEGGTSLRGSISADPVADINASFDAEKADAETAELLGPPQPVRQTVEYTIESGDTLGRVLTELGVASDDARAAVNALAKHFKPRDLKIGQTMSIELETLPIEVAAVDEHDITPPAPSLIGFTLKADSERSLNVAYDAEETAFTSREVFRELTKRVVRAEGTIAGSLFGAAGRLGVPNAIMVDFTKLYSYSVDFQREIRKGDSFEVYYSEYADEDGEFVKSGDILYASLDTGGKPLSLWRFEIPGEDTVDYFDANGRSTKKFLMRTPIDGARISSSFGKRRHPILGYTKMHTGTDFAAPTGTPIYAAGNGTIVKAGWNGGYGKYVKIRHANGYETAYAHMHRIGKGITPGARVKQGQTIGYVGTTGRSTGPHLHYEVHVKGKKVNPMKIRVPTGRKLEGKALTAFKKARDGMKAEMAQVESLKPVTTASAVTTDDDASVE